MSRFTGFRYFVPNILPRIVDPFVNEEVNEIVRYSENLEGKTYITGKGESVCANIFNKDYERIINNYLDRKIKYIDIINRLNKVNNEIKIYKKETKNFMITIHILRIK